MTIDTTKPRWVLLEFSEVPERASFRYNNLTLERAHNPSFGWNYDNVYWRIPFKAVVAMSFKEYAKFFASI